MGCSHPLRKKKLPYESDLYAEVKAPSTASTLQLSEVDAAERRDQPTIQNMAAGSRKIMHTERRQSVYIANPAQMETRLHPSYSVGSNLRKQDIIPSNDGNYYENYEQTPSFSFGHDYPVAAPLAVTRYRSSTIGALPSQESALMGYTGPLTIYLRKYEDYLNKNYHPTLTLGKSMNVPYLKTCLRHLLTHFTQICNWTDDQIFQELAKSMQFLVREQLTDFSKRLWTNQVEQEASPRVEVAQILNELYSEGLQQPRNHEAYWAQVILCLQRKFN